jgi:hypothetical protein
MESQRKEGGRGGSSSMAPPDAAAGAGCTTTRQQHLKVKHIVTTEVSTDEASFKDVVQSLTGKDSGPARAAVVAAGSRTSRSNDGALLAGGAAGIVNHGTVAGVLLSSSVGMKYNGSGGVRD